MSIRLLSRSDDFGSSLAANKAIIEGVKKGLIIKNVSCMAPAPYIREGAEALRELKGFDIGMHATVNSEWKGIRFKALSEKAHESRFAYEDGSFLYSQQELAKAEPDVEEVIKEYGLQLDFLTKLGLKVSYVDSHMFPEYFIPGLYDALMDFIDGKGLINAEDYYTLHEPLAPETREDEEAYLDGVEGWLGSLSDGGQHFYLTHPAADSEESLLMYNDVIPKGAMRLERRMEHLAVTSDRWTKWFDEFGIVPVRYSEAEKTERGVMKGFFNHE